MLFARKASYCYFNDCEFGNNLNYLYFRLKSSDFNDEMSGLRELLW